MPSHHASLCPECGAPLEADGVCLACIFGEALAAKDNEGEMEEADSRFGSFAPQVAGQFGKYLLRRALGAGGMGVIWEAEDPAVRRLVALKMIRGFAFATKADKLRFRTEVNAAAQLDHPHIVPVYEVSEAEGQPYFTMKLLEGGSLSERLKAGALDAREAAGLMEKLARAVQHAHERGVLHRDLKPGNVLFDKAGEPFLTDFGLAKLVDVEQVLTLSHAQVGTPQYMSPEQARGRTRDVTTASDVWALGAMLYQMLTGRLPFPGQTPAEIFSHIAHDEPVSLRTLAASAGRDLETLCLRCLEKEPARRLVSAGQLADELARWKRGEPIFSRRVTGRERALRWARRYPWLVAAGTALVVSLLTGTIVSLALWRGSEANRRNAVANGEHATKLVAAERFTGYVSTMAAVLAARERHDFARARQLLTAAPEEHRGLEWRLLDQLCAGDQRSLFRLPGGALPDALSTGPDGESLAIVTHDGVLHLCRPDGSALRPPRRLPVLSGEPDVARLNPYEYHSLAYAPGGKHFACSFRNTVRVFDAETLEVVMKRSEFLVQPQTAWLDERRLLFGNDRSTITDSGTCAWIFDAQDRSTLELPQAWSAPLAVSADRSVVALTGPAHREVSFLRATDLSGAAPLQNATPFGRWTDSSYGAPGWGNVLVLSADGRYFATLCGPFVKPAYYLEVAETATGQTPLRKQGFLGAMTGLVFHPTEPLVAVVGTDAVVRMFNFLKPIPEGPPTYDDDCDWSIREPLNGNGAHSPPRRLLTRSAQDGRAAFLLGHEGRGNGAVFARDGASLFTSAGDGTVRCWNPSVPAPPTRITSVDLIQIERHPSVSPDGSRLLYSSGFPAVRYWQEGRGYTHLADYHLPLAVLPAGRLATMEIKTSDIILWQEEGETIRETDRIPGPGYIQGFDKLLRGLVFPGGTKIAGITPGRVFVVDLEKRTVSATSDQGWETGPSRAWDMAISPDGRHLAATGLGRRVRLYDPADLTKPAPPIGEFRSYDTALAFHPDGSRLYCGNEDGRVRVFDTTTWTELPEEIWQAHRGAVTALAISNDTRLLATSGDTTLKLWLTEKAAGAARVEMLSFSTYFPAAWLHFGRDADGSDRSLLHAQPFCPLEIWPGSRSPVIATPPDRVSPLKVLRAP
jgi:WD40 repeat protein